MRELRITRILKDAVFQGRNVLGPNEQSVEFFPRRGGISSHTCLFLFFFFNYLLELRALLHFRVFFYENYGTKEVYDNDDNEKYWHKDSKITSEADNDDNERYLHKNSKITSEEEYTTKINAMR